MFIRTRQQLIIRYTKNLITKYHYQLYYFSINQALSKMNSLYGHVNTLMLLLMIKTLCKLRKYVVMP